MIKLTQQFQNIIENLFKKITKMKLLLVHWGEGNFDTLKNLYISVKIWKLKFL